MIGQNRCSAPEEALQALGTHLAEACGLGARGGGKLSSLSYEQDKAHFSDVHNVGTGSAFHIAFSGD